MFILDLFEGVETMDTIVVYPGRFQPWHKGHRAVYDYLVSNFGRDRVFIATSNKVDPPRSPFSFSEKLQFMHLTGITSDSVVETRDPYKVPELVGKVDAGRTRIIFAVSQKDMDEDPRFKFGTKKDGTPTYFQPMPKDAYQMQSLDKHGYIMVVPTFNFTVLGQPMTSATQVRAQFAQSDDKTQREIIKDLFGSYSLEIHQIMKNKITLSESVITESKVLDLTKNFSNHALVHAKVIDVLPSGKVKLEIIKADPIAGKKPTVAVGQKVSMAVNYLRRAPEINEFAPPSSGGDPGGKVYVLAPKPEDRKKFKVEITDVNHEEFQNVWNSLPRVYHSFYGNIYPFWNVRNPLFAKMPITKYTLEQYILLVGSELLLMTKTNVQSGKKAGDFSGSTDLTETNKYEYLPPGASAAQTRNVLDKTKQKIAGSNKFVWLKPNQISGSHTEQELLQLGFKKSAFGGWGGTQAMWNRLAGIKEMQAVRLTK